MEVDGMIGNFHIGDIVAIVLYFIIVFAVGIWTTLRKDKGTTTGYFLAGRRMTWLPIGASVFASNVGAPMFVGLAGQAAAGGIAVTTYEWHAVYMILLLAWFFLPVYLASGCKTMPEYMSKRFHSESGRVRILFSIVTLFGYVSKSIVSQMYAGAIFIKVMLGWNVYWSCLIVLILTGLYSILGGLAAVMWTDTVQAFIVIAGSAVIAIMSLIAVGGYERMKDMFMIAAAPGSFEQQVQFGNVSCALPRDDSFHLLRNPVSGDLPWPGMTFGLTSMAMWVWCNDQVMVQRALSAKTLVHAKGGAVFASFLKYTSFFLFIIPGLATRALYPEFVACASPEACLKACGSSKGCTNYAYPKLVTEILPTGATGLLIAALMSALISSLTSEFNSASSIFTIDIWPRIRKQAKQSELMVVGRLFIVFIAALAMAWLPILENSGDAQLWNYLQALTSYLTPPCSMLFLLSILWGRMTEPAAFWGVLGGMVTGVIRMSIDFAYPIPVCGSGEEDTRPAILKDVHFLHFAIILSLVSLGLMVVISFLTKPPEPKQLAGLLWWTRNQKPVYMTHEQKTETSLTPKVPEADKEVLEADKKVPEADTQVEDMTKGRSKLARVCLFWLCGIGQANSKSENEAIREENQHDYTKSSPAKNLIVNCAAVICLTMITFLFGFFA